MSNMEGTVIITLCSCSRLGGARPGVDSTDRFLLRVSLDITSRGAKDNMCEFSVFNTGCSDIRVEET